MLKQITLHGQRLELHSLDGKTWCSKIADVIAAKRKKAATEIQIKTMSGNIYLRRVNDNYGYDAEDYLPVHLKKGLRQ